MMAEKLSFIDPMDDSLCFSLHECQDEVTSTLLHADAHPLAHIVSCS